MLWIDGYACFFGAVLLLTLPLNWFLAAVTAAAVHELCHMLMVYAAKGRVMQIGIGIGGMQMEISPMPPGKELLCALAGPVGSLLLLGCFRWCPRLAVCAGVQAAYNLLPIYPLDGGRVLRCFVYMANRERLCDVVEKAALAGVCLLAVGLTFLLRMGIYPVVLAGLLIIKKNSLQCGASRGTIVLHHLKR